MFDVIICTYLFPLSLTTLVMELKFLWLGKWMMK